MEAESRTENGALGPDSNPAIARTDADDSNHRRKLHQIVADGHRYNFFQLVEILSRLTEDGGSREGKIRFRPSSQTVFPATDVKKVEWRGKPDDPIVIVASFMGLYGFDSPLPAYLSRSIEISAETTPLQSLLDIFNNRLYRFFFRAWKKYRPARAVRTGETNESSKRFLAIAGLSADAQASKSQDEPLRLAAFAGQLGSIARSADGLRNLLRGILRGIPVQIEENIPRWVWLTERGAIGNSEFSSAAILGATATIGEKIRDLSGKFRIVLGPLDLEQFESCLPGGMRAKQIQSVVDHFVTDFLDFDVELRLLSSEVPGLVLGDSRRHLGLNTWLRQPATTHTSRLVSYANPTAAA